MRLAVINPNSTVSFTDKIAAAAIEASGPGVTVEGITCTGSPPAIQGKADGDAATPFVLEEVARAEAAGADACVIACFDDTGLAEARAAVRIPVVGIGEAGYHAAILLGHRFSVVTTLSVSVPVLAGNIEAYGLAGHCARVRASEVPVLDLEREGSDARDRISAEIATALTEDAATAIVLGCAGMADLAADLAAKHGVPVIDGVAAACGLAATLVRLGPAARRPIV
jgi:allantoin racemase